MEPRPTVVVGENCVNPLVICVQMIRARSMNNTRDNEDDEVNNLRNDNESDGLTTGQQERRLNPEAREYVPREVRARRPRVVRSGRGSKVHTLVRNQAEYYSDQPRLGAGQVQEWRLRRRWK